MAISDLMDALNGSGLSVPVAGSLLGILLIALLLLMMRRRRPSTVDVDDSPFERDERESKSNASKKKKHKKAQVKVTNATSENSSPAKVSSQQSPVKNTSREKQADEKTKPAQKKEKGNSRQQVQQMAEASGDWTVAGSKKKPKAKKTDSSVENLKTKTTSNIQSIRNPKTVDSKEMAISGEVILSDKVIEVKSSVTEEHNSIVHKNKGNDDITVLLHEPNHAVLHKMLASSSQKPDGLLSPSPVESDEGNLEAVQSPGMESSGKESKSKKSSKKKKSKLTTEITQNPVSNSQDGEKAANDSLISKVDHQPRNGELLPNDVSAASGTSEDVSKGKVPVISKDEAVRMPKDLSKGKSGNLLKEVFEVPSKNKAPGASKTSPENGTSDMKISSKPVNSSSIPDNFEETGLRSDAAKSVFPAVVNDVAGPSSGTAPSQIVFDELGLKDEALNSSQPGLKKKKKARRDV